MVASAPSFSEFAASSLEFSAKDNSNSFANAAKFSSRIFNSDCDFSKASVSMAKSFDSVSISRSSDEHFSRSIANSSLAASNASAAFFAAAEASAQCDSSFSIRVSNSLTKTSLSVVVSALLSSLFSSSSFVVVVVVSSLLALRASINCFSNSSILAPSVFARVAAASIATRAVLIALSAFSFALFANSFCVATSNSN